MHEVDIICTNEVRVTLIGVNPRCTTVAYLRLQRRGVHEAGLKPLHVSALQRYAFFVLFFVLLGECMYTVLEELLLCTCACDGAVCMKLA